VAARRYRLRLYDDGADVTGDRDWLVALDLDDGLGVASARADLDRLLGTLARHDGAKAHHLHRYYLSLHDWETDERVCHWPPLQDREDDKAWA
jgi:hypothetical protein